MSSTLGKKQYLLLGRLLVLRHPEVANQLLGQISVDHQEADFSRVPEYYQAFCGIVNIDPLEYQGPLNETTKVDVRRLFVSVMLHLYTPQVYNHPADSIIIRRGFVKAVSGVLLVDPDYMSRFIRQTISMERHYDWYREKVDATRQTLTYQTQHHGNQNQA